MLTESERFIRMVEVNPPVLPDMSHLFLEGSWEHVLVTDNVFGRTRVSPYAFSARITHDAPSVSPTVVISTRDRNILAIESEVRGALGNGIDSFLVVVGDTLPHVEHLADPLEIVQHLRALQSSLPNFEVGMPTAFSAKAKQRHVDDGAQFLVAGPLLDPASVGEHVAKLGLRPQDPPVLIMAIPPFSTRWVDRMESIGARPATDALRRSLDEAPNPTARRAIAWESSLKVTAEAESLGCAGTVLMGLRFETVVDEAALAWNSSTLR